MALLASAVLPPPSKIKVNPGTGQAIQTPAFFSAPSEFAIKWPPSNLSKTSPESNNGAVWGSK
ncbi:hypothetical protein CCACVL1_30165 [Corchorus capsularis]|uniref:Uncharacterized protein n=1 Tax=Corchorus capsularis TaxID=210143 RepID=A0A1R3FYH4_COCAP|nr:hypothetical protein CCACVL1_30165 [Corchorus capsularis]